ncbi:MAG TPA: MarR family winged helix-turn-helix transcriptional regulator [Alphaproteobacteria bacterium]|nr:MarR family winged helix-turn-helix transcriptional regulator [Alphaproteobacteria bacterium]
MPDVTTQPAAKARGTGNCHPADAQLALDRFIPYRLSVLSNTVSRAIARIYARRFGLAVADWRVMAVLGQDAPLSARDVCTLTAMDKVRVSRAVGRLIARDLVERAISVRDRRLSVLSLSPAGQAIYRQVVPLALDAEAKLLDGLSTEEHRQFDRLLDKLRDRARTLGDADPHGNPHNEGSVD